MLIPRIPRPMRIIYPGAPARRTQYPTSPHFSPILKNKNGGEKCEETRYLMKEAVRSIPPDSLFEIR
jgi:hypothetical protein